MTFDDELGQVNVERSFYGCSRGAANQDDIVYYKVSSNKTQINDIICSRFNRKGRLCGRRQEDYSPVVYSVL
jgi:hypothetical protein